MSGPQFTLYHYWRSSSSWRVRFALHHKGIAFTPVAVDLLNGESESPEHLKRNPAGFVPVLEFLNGPHQGAFLSESLSIIRFLEEAYPNSPTLFPGNAFDHARIWSLAEIINSGTQPLANIPVNAFHSGDAEEQKRWARHWMKTGLETYETHCRKHAGDFSYGNQFSLADICLIPQLYNADRFSVDLKDCPTLLKVRENVKKLPAYTLSEPDSYKPVDFKG